MENSSNKKDAILWLCIAVLGSSTIWLAKDKIRNCKSMEKLQSKYLRLKLYAMAIEEELAKQRVKNRNNV